MHSNLDTRAETLQPLVKGKFFQLPGTFGMTLAFFFWRDVPAQSD